MTTNTITYSNSHFDMSENLMASLLHMDRDMKIKVIALLSKSLCDNGTEDDAIEDHTLKFPILPHDFKISDSIKMMGTKFPDDFNYFVDLNIPVYTPEEFMNNCR